MLSALQTLTDNGLTSTQLQSVLNDLADEDGFEDDDDRRCCIALLYYYDNVGGCDPDDCEIAYDDVVRVANNEYRVLTDGEADDAFDEYLEQLLDESGMVPGVDSFYFDREAWKRDAAIDGRGFYLAVYDGIENECGRYFVYRVN